MWIQSKITSVLGTCRHADQKIPAIVAASGAWPDCRRCAALHRLAAPAIQELEHHTRGRLACTWGSVLFVRRSGRHHHPLEAIPSNIPEGTGRILPSVTLKMAQFGRSGTMLGEKALDDRISLQPGSFRLTME